jgi:DNA modification methylase
VPLRRNDPRRAARCCLGDCLDVLRGLPDASVDAVVTDPPYGQSNEKYDKGVDPDVWRECFRVAKPNAALLSFAGSPTYHRIACGIEAAGWRVRQMWAWVYRDGMLTSAWPKEGFDRLAPAFDPICYATKGKVILHLIRTGGGYTRTRKPVGYSARSRAVTETTRSGRLPRQIVADEGVDGFEWFAMPRTGRTHSKDKTGHPNQKPIALMDWLVGKLPPGGTVLDPFMGSGTTGVACIQSGRRFVGIEKDSGYHEIAVRRIAQVEAQALAPAW